MSRSASGHLPNLTLSLNAGLLAASIGAFLTGFGLVPAHPWLGLAWTCGLGWHLALHRAGISALMRRWLGPLALRVRLRVVLHLALLADVVALASSGAIVTQIYAPGVIRFHAGAAWAFVALAGLHLILNARWIGAQLRRVAARRVSPARERGPAGTGITLS